MSLWDLIYSQSHSQNNGKFDESDDFGFMDTENVELDNVLFDEDVEDNISSPRKASRKQSRLISDQYRSKPYENGYPDHVKHLASSAYFRAPEIFYMNEKNDKRGLRATEFMPGLSSYSRFSQPKIEESKLYQSVAKQLWDHTYCSGDLHGASMVLGLLTDICRLELSDLYRVIEMVRQHHHSSYSTDGIKLATRLQTIMRGSFGDNNLCKRHAFRETRTYLIAAYIYLLVVENEVLEAVEILNSRAADPAYFNSSLLVTTKAILLCVIVTNFVHRHQGVFHPSYIPTMRDISTDPLSFSFIVECLTSNQSKSFHKKYPNWSTDCGKHIRELKLAMNTALKKIEYNILFQKFYIAFEIGQQNFSEVKKHLHVLRHAITEKQFAGYLAHSIYDVIMITLSRYFCSDTNSRTVITNMYRKSIQSQNKESVYNRYNISTVTKAVDLLKTLLLFKFSTVSLGDVLKVICNIIEVNKISHFSLTAKTSSTTNVNSNSNSSSQSMPISHDDEVNRNETGCENNCNMNSDELLERRLHWRVWNILCVILGPVTPKTREEPLSHSSELFAYLIDRGLKEDIFEVVNNCTSSSQSNSSQAQEDHYYSVGNANQHLNRSLPFSMSSSSSSSFSPAVASTPETVTNTSTTLSPRPILDTFIKDKSWWTYTIFSSFQLGDLVNYINEFEVQTLLDGVGMQSLQGRGADTLLLKLNNFWICDLESFSSRTARSNVEKNCDDSDDDLDLDSNDDNTENCNNDNFHRISMLIDPGSYEKNCEYSDNDDSESDCTANTDNDEINFTRAPKQSKSHITHVKSMSISGAHNTSSSEQVWAALFDLFALNCYSRRHIISFLSSGDPIQAQAQAQTLNLASDHLIINAISFQLAYGVETRSFPAYRTSFWPRPQNRFDHWNFHSEKFLFTKLGENLLEILTYQIIVCCHLHSQDCLFAVRGVQIILQHVMFNCLEKIPITVKPNSSNAFYLSASKNSKKVGSDSKVRKRLQRYRLNTDMISHSHMCLQLLIDSGVNIPRSVYLASTCYSHNVSPFEALAPLHSQSKNSAASVNSLDYNSQCVGQRIYVPF